MKSKFGALDPVLLMFVNTNNHHNIMKQFLNYVQMTHRLSLEVGCTRKLMPKSVRSVKILVSRVEL